MKKIVKKSYFINKICLLLIVSIVNTNIYPVFATNIIPEIADTVSNDYSDESSNAISSDESLSDSIIITDDGIGISDNIIENNDKEQKISVTVKEINGQ